MGNLDALGLEILTVLWGSQAPLKPLRHTTAQQTKETSVQSGFALEQCQNNNSPLSLTTNASQPNITFTPMQTSNPTYFS